MYETDSLDDAMMGNKLFQYVCLHCYQCNCRMFSGKNISIEREYYYFLNIDKDST